MLAVDVLAGRVNAIEGEIMSYPPPLYPGGYGESTATYRRAGHPPELQRSAGTNVHYLATGASTAGQFGLYRWEMGAAPGGPDPHFHRTISESFYILEGSVAIFDGGTWIDTEPGDWVHAPAGGIHGFKNTSGAPAKMLLHFCPGAPREEYFERLPDLQDAPEEERAAFFLKHDTFWV
jgi:mannose-6-phosphate isomerase-like protein (cupin superfamily)